MSAHVIPEPLLQIATAFQRSQTLFALVEFRIPTRLARRPLTVGELAAATHVHPLALERFVDACTALGLLRRTGAMVRNTRIARRFLVHGAAEYLGDSIAHYDRVTSERWRSLRSRLTSWSPTRKVARVPRTLQADLDSLRAHHNLNLIVGERLAARYPFGRHRRLLDLGGGTGASSIAICRRHSGLRALVIDRPAVVRLARGYVKRSGVSGRIRLRAADFLSDPLPSGFDLALLSSVLSTMSERHERALLGRIHDRLAPGGVLLVCGWILDADRLGPLLGVLFCLNDISWCSPDVERSATTYARWLRAAGFAVTGHRTVTPPWSVLIARKPLRAARGGRPRP